MCVTVLALEENDFHCVVSDQWDHFEGFKFAKTLITEMLPTGEDTLPAGDDISNSFADNLLVYLSGIIKILAQRNQIVGVIDKIQKLLE